MLWRSSSVKAFSPRRVWAEERAPPFQPVPWAIRVALIPVRPSVTRSVARILPAAFFSAAASQAGCVARTPAPATVAQRNCRRLQL